MSPDEIELYGLETNEREATNFVAYRYFERLMRPVLNDVESRVLSENKWVFHQLARSAGLPVPRTFALYDPMQGVTHDGRPCASVDDVMGLLQREQPNGLVIKPAGGIQGRGVLVYDEVDPRAGKARTQAGETVDLRELVVNLPAARFSSGSGHVLQEPVSQHLELSRINPDTINTLRIVTHISHDGDVRIPFAAVRFGRSGNVVDNWSRGGISVGVDIENGQMKRGVLKPKYGGRWITSHPDTHVEFAGTFLPMWSRAIELCRRASRDLPGLRSIGWDLVITSSGPVILEANERHSLVMVQVHSDGWLAQPGVREDLAADGFDLPRRVPSTPLTAAQVLKRRTLKHGQQLMRRSC